MYYFIYDPVLDEAGVHPIDFIGFDWSEESVAMFADSHPNDIYFEAELVPPERPGRNEFEIVVGARSTNVMIYVDDIQVIPVRVKEEADVQYLAERFPQFIYFIEA